jgi:hypothetical protein
VLELCIENPSEDGTSVLKHAGAFNVTYEYMLYSVHESAVVVVVTMDARIM